MNALGQLFYVGLGHTQGQPVVSPDTTLDGFQNLQPYLYWSCEAATPIDPCTEGAPVAGQAWSFSFGNGFLGTDLVQNDLYVMVYYPHQSVVTKPGCGKGSSNVVTCR